MHQDTAATPEDAGAEEAEADAAAEAALLWVRGGRNGRESPPAEHQASSGRGGSISVSALGMYRSWPCHTAAGATTELGSRATSPSGALGGTEGCVEDGGVHRAVPPDGLAAPWAPTSLRLRLWARPMAPHIMRTVKRKGPGGSCAEALAVLGVRTQALPSTSSAASCPPDRVWLSAKTRGARWAGLSGAAASEAGERRPLCPAMRELVLIPPPSLSLIYAP